MASSKPSLASVAAGFMGGEEDGEEEEGMGEEYSAAVAELASVLGVPDEKMGALQDALEAVIRSCK